tara:strand:- start:10515 stop:11072 length:558 start_codon:yes stop_codon:yes gene_type:complete
MAQPPKVKPNTYQWIRTERKGEISTVSHTEDGFYVFEDGTKCSVEVAKEVLYQIPTPEDRLIDLGEKIESAKENRAKRKPLAGKLQPKKSEREVGDNMYTGAPDNPIRELLKRQSSNNKMRSELTIDVSLPKPSVYEILKESFGDDVDSEITQMAIESININELKEQVDKLLKKKVKSYYSKSKK